MQPEQKHIEPNRAQQHNRLGELNRLIRECWASSEELAGQARQYANQAVTERILCGHYLNEMKAIVGHGRWLKWLTTHRPEISQDSAQRAMRLATASTVTDLSQAKNITEAYRICGILPTTEEKTPARRRDPIHKTAIAQLSKIRARIESDAFKSWPAPALEKLRTELKPLVLKLWPTVPI